MNSASETARSARIGFLAIVILWITGSFTVPIIKILRPHFSSEELLFVRSLFGGVVSFMLVGNRVWRTNRVVKIAGSVMAFSSIGFYRAIQTWDISPVMVIITLVPAVNIIINMMNGKKIPLVLLASFGLIVIGIVCTLDPWKQPINLKGMAWALFSVVTAGVGFEFWGKASKNITISEKCFWFALPLLILTPIIIFSTQMPFDVGRYSDPKALKLIVLFGFANGIIYTYATIVPFSSRGKMDTAVASVLMQVLTPCTIISACYLTGEVLDLFQWIGVFIALSGATFLSIWLIKKPKENSP